MIILSMDERNSLSFMFNLINFDHSRATWHPKNSLTTFIWTSNEQRYTGHDLFPLSPLVFMDTFSCFIDSRSYMQIPMNNTDVTELVNVDSHDSSVKFSPSREMAVSSKKIYKINLLLEMFTLVLLNLFTVKYVNSKLKTYFELKLTVLPIILTYKKTIWNRNTYQNDDFCIHFSSSKKFFS